MSATKAKKRKRLCADFTMTSVLKVIDRFFVEANPSERNKLWDVLSALRGPDFAGMPRRSR